MTVFVNAKCLPAQTIDLRILGRKSTLIKLRYSKDKYFFDLDNTNIDFYCSLSLDFDNIAVT